MWFDKNGAQFDASGRFIGYEGGWTGKAFFLYPSICVYDAAGELESILEYMPEEVEKELWRVESSDFSDRISGSIVFSRHKNGNIRAAEYWRDSRTHGTTDQTGKIYYDEAGRMICNTHYITHGEHVNIFLYEGDSNRPWACLYWCSFGNVFKQMILYKAASPVSRNTAGALP
jgi:hypothetical protein